MRGLSSSLLDIREKTTRPLPTLQCITNFIRYIFQHILSYTIECDIHTIILYFTFVQLTICGFRKTKFYIRSIPT